MGSIQPFLVDTHAHFVPPIYRQVLLETGNEHADGMPGIPAWDEASQLAMMDDLNISKSILSISSPGTSLLINSNFSKPEAQNYSVRRLTRETNEFAADLKSRHPSRFGFWASLPLPDVDGALEELSYALDELHADGITLLTNRQGYYLGDKTFEPLFAELDRRSVTVFVHPTAPCMRGLSHNAGGCVNATPLPQYPIPIFEFFFDTARAIINLFYSGTITRYPNITYIFSHCGGVIPPLVERFSSVPSLLPSSVYDKDVSPQNVKTALRSSQFYFDLAGWSFPDQLKGLLPFVSTKQLLYGSDFPHTPLSAVRKLKEQVREGLKDLFPEEEDRRLIYGGNAERLLQGRNRTST